MLLVRRADDGNWELPGGRVDLGESAATAVIREVAEEADVAITVAAVAGVYSDPGHVLADPDGQVHQQFAVCFHAVADDPAPAPDGEETTAATWFEPDATRSLLMHPVMRERLDHALKRSAQVHFD